MFHPITIQISIQPERSAIQSKPYSAEIWPSKLLRELIAEEEAMSEDERITLPFNPEKIAYPETSRWCLCGIKNLSRPSKDPVAALTIIKCGALDAILRILTIGSASAPQTSNDFIGVSSNAYRDMNLEDCVIRNDPYVWDSSSMQDAALYILMNLAITPATRPDIRNSSVVRKISAVARFSISPANGSSNLDEEEQKNLQCLKAVSS